MAANRLEGVKQNDEPARNGAESHAAAPAASGGMKAWLPLVLNIVLMPAIAYGITTFVLIPKLGGGKVAQAAPASSGHGEEPKAAGKSESKGKGGKPGKITAPLSGKVLVNVAGTMGTRYLLASMTLVGSSPELKNRVEENDPQLRDAAAGILSAKSISDLEKPGMRNIIRTELISTFNDILGKDSVTEIYLTEFAIQ